MENENRNMAFDETNTIQMTIPERITLSAGYDGDDNHNDPSPPLSNFDETPLVDADLVMGGMPTPPSVLTIDHSVGENFVGTTTASSDSFASSSPNWHMEGDGADDDENETTLSKYTRLNTTNDFANTHGLSRSVEIVGRESNMEEDTIVLEDQSTVLGVCVELQRRLTELEKNLEYQNRVSNVWRISLLTLTFVYPIVLHYFLSSKRR